jgi:hypothetical protein
MALVVLLQVQLFKFLQVRILGQVQIILFLRLIYFVLVQELGFISKITFFLIFLVIFQVQQHLIIHGVQVSLSFFMLRLHQVQM